MVVQQPLTYNFMVRDMKVLVNQAIWKAVLEVALGCGSALSEHIILSAVMRSFMRIDQYDLAQEQSIGQK